MNLKEWALIGMFICVLFAASASGAGLERMAYNNPGLVVDLGVGLQPWPLPMDYDGDGDNDLVISCSDKPYNGMYFFENPSGDVKMPVFKPAVKIGPGTKNIQVSYVGGKARLLKPAEELVDFRNTGFKDTTEIYSDSKIHVTEGRVRAKQWKYCDFEDDGDLDLVVGVGDWTDYGWDNAFDKQGRWTHGPLHGYIYLVRNKGTSERPAYAAPKKVRAGGQPIDVYGMPSPNVADFDGDGDLDILCGEFVDSFTYFENIGRRIAPKYATGRKLLLGRKPLRMDLCMIGPAALDWDKDGDVDLVVGQEDGRVALVENTGKVRDGLPRFLPPRFFRQEAADVKFGALATPYSFDWDGDGDEDLLCGNTAGYIGFIENLNGGDPPKWAEPKYLETDGKVIRIMAGPNGSIQGPCEAKWGYTTLSVADWDHDGLADIVVNSIWGKVVWFRNRGRRGKPQLEAARPIEVAWTGKAPKPEWNWWNPEGKSLTTQWRTTPVVIDLNRDGLNDLVMLDHEGYLAWFERAKRDGQLILLPGKRVFECEEVSAFDNKHNPQGRSGGLLQLNAGFAGKSGRRKLCLVDWDRDGRIDLLVNSQNVNFMRNVSTDESKFVFRDMGKVDDRILAGHTTSPTIVDWDRNGVPDLLIGAEDGYFYYLKNPAASRCEDYNTGRGSSKNLLQYQISGREFKELRSCELGEYSRICRAKL